MSISSTLSTALTGLSAAQQVLNIVSQNIANVNTPGYSKQTVQLQETTIAGVPTGVSVSQITHFIDTYLLQQLRGATSNLYNQQTANSYLTNVNNLFGTPTGQTSISAGIASTQSVLGALASTPADANAQNTAVQSLSNLAGQINALATQVQSQRSAADQAIVQTVTDINTQLKAIAAANTQIVTGKAANQSTAATEDQRNQAMNQLAQDMNFTYSTNSDGSVSIYSGSQTLLAGSNVQTISYTPALNLSARIAYTPPTASNYLAPSSPSYPVGGVGGIFVGSPLTAGNDITTGITGGSLGGLVAMRDQALPAVQAQLDELARQIRNQLNIASNTGTATPAPSSLTGTRFVTASSSFGGASGVARISILGSNGGAVASAAFDLSKYNTVGDLINGINGKLSGFATAAIVNNHLQISAVAGKGSLSLSEDTSNLTTTTGGTGWSGYFGMNDVMTTVDDASSWLSAPASSGTTLLNSTGSLRISYNNTVVNVGYASSDTLSGLVTKINTALGAGAPVTASLLTTGSGVQLQLLGTSGQQFTVDEGMQVTSAAFATSATPVGGAAAGGTLTFNGIVSAGGAANPVSIAYTNASTVTTLAAAINANATLTAAGVTAVVTATNQLQILGGNISVTDSQSQVLTASATAFATAATPVTANGGLTFANIAGGPVTLNYAAGTTTPTTMAAAINGNATLGAAGITAVVNGSNQLVIRGNPLTLTDSAGAFFPRNSTAGTMTKDFGLTTISTGNAGSMAVRASVAATPSLIPRGSLSTTYGSVSLARGALSNLLPAAWNPTAPGGITVQVSGTNPITVPYATTDTLASIAANINAAKCGVNASVVNYGPSQQLRIVPISNTDVSITGNAGGLALAPSDVLPAAGTLTFTTPGPKSTTLNYGGGTPPSQTLNQLAAQINSTVPNVIATVVFNGTNQWLSVSSKDGADLQLVDSNAGTGNALFATNAVAPGADSGFQSAAIPVTSTSNSFVTAAAVGAAGTLTLTAGANVATIAYLATDTLAGVQAKITAGLAAAVPLPITGIVPSVQATTATQSQLSLSGSGFTLSDTGPLFPPTFSAAAPGGTLTIGVAGLAAPVPVAYATGNNLAQIAAAINATVTGVPALNTLVKASVIATGNGTQELQILPLTGAVITSVTDTGTQLGFTAFGAQGVGPGNNVAATAMNNAFNNSVTFRQAPADGSGLPNLSTTLGSYAASIISAVAGKTANSTTQQSYYNSLVQNISSRNTAESGVNMDSELSQMVVYQNAYSASAKVISTASQLLQTLLQMS